MDQYLLGPQEEEKKAEPNLLDQNKQFENSMKEDNVFLISQREQAIRQFGSSGSSGSSVDLQIASSRSELPSLSKNFNKLEHDFPYKPYLDLTDKSEEKGHKEEFKFPQKRKRISQAMQELNMSFAAQQKTEKEKKLDSSPSFKDNGILEEYREYQIDENYNKQLFVPVDELQNNFRTDPQFESKMYKMKDQEEEKQPTLPFSKKGTLVTTGEQQTTTQANLDNKQLLTSGQDFSNNFRAGHHKITAFFPNDLIDHNYKEDDQQTGDSQQTKSEPGKASEDIKRNSIIQLKKVQEAAETEQNEKQNTKNKRKKRDFFQKLPLNSCKEVKNLFQANLSSKKKNSSQLAALNTVNHDIQRFHSVIQSPFPRHAYTRQEQCSSSGGQSQEEFGTVIIEVKDTGKGISEEGIQKLFQPFQQEDKTISKNFGGTGLGLSICKDLVTLMNGTIKVESKIRVSTQFTITLPLRKAVDISEMIDDEELGFDQLELDLALFEFVIINNQRSYEIQQIKKALTIAGQQFSVYESSQLKDQQLFKRENSIKAVISDFATLSSKKWLLPLLNQLSEEVDLSEPSLSRQASQIMKVIRKIPLIVVASDLEDDYKLPRGENIFTLKTPLNHISIQKMMLMVRKYYYSSSSESKRVSPMTSKEQITGIKSGSSDISIPQFKLAQDGQQSFGIYQKDLNEDSSHTTPQTWKILRNKMETNKKTSTFVLGGEVRRSPWEKKQSSSKFLQDRLGDDLEPKSQSHSSSKTILPKAKQSQQFSSKVLIVNDERLLLEVTEQLINVVKEELRKDIVVLKARDGLTAVDLFQQQQLGSVKLILMDVHMPGLNGYEATQKIRMLEEQLKSPEWTVMPAYIVGMSGDTDKRHVQMCRTSGMNEVLLQNITLKKVRELILQAEC